MKGEEMKGDGEGTSNPSVLSDVELARTYAECGLSGRCSEWPQLRPLLGRLAARIEALDQILKGLAGGLPNG